MKILRTFGVLLAVVVGLAAVALFGNFLGQRTTQDAIAERLQSLLEAEAVALRIEEIAPFAWVRACVGGPNDPMRDVLPEGVDPAIVPARDDDSRWSLLLISNEGTVRAVGIPRGPLGDLAEGARCADRETATLVREVRANEWDLLRLHGRDG